jgi:diguanylate cyclase
MGLLSPGNELMFRMWNKVSWKTVDRLFLSAFLAFVMASWGGLFDPLDAFALRPIRNSIRTHSASGDIAIVTIDGASKAKYGEWPWPSSQIAELVNKINEAGAKRIFIEHVLMASADQVGDTALVKALSGSKERPVIAARIETDSMTKEKRFLEPSQAFRKVADVGAVNVFVDGVGQVEKVPLSIQMGNEAYPSFASLLSNRMGQSDQRAQIDYSVDANSFEQIGASSILSQQFKNSLRGKDVVLNSYNSTIKIQSIGPRPVIYAQVLGAETLKKGMPISLSWLVIIPFGLAFGALIRFGSRRLAFVGIAGGFVTGLIIPFYLEARLIFVNVGGLLGFVGVIAAVRIWEHARKNMVRTNPHTGMANMEALRNTRIKAGDAVIAVRIKGYAEMLTAFPEDIETRLVKEISKRLSAAQSTKIYQGDEGIFAWIARRAEVTELGDHLDALHSMFMRPVVIDPWHIDVNLAFGIDNGSERDTTKRFASALVAADDALGSGNRWALYAPERLNEAEWNLSLLGRLDAAIEQGEVWVAYQPKYDLKTRRTTGMEALARWTHPERGAISPDIFVTHAEKNGRIDKLTYFVIDEALATVKMLAEQGQHIEVAVNLSTNMFDRPEFLGRLDSALKKYGVPPTQLTMEITETAAARSEVEMNKMIAGLRKMGVLVSIDDYGTGHSTLEYLAKINADEVKIDRNFVDPILHNRVNYVCVNATIELAHSLGRKVVAEGVESVEVMELLARMKCDSIQGYHIAKPMSQAAIVDFVLADHALALAA